VEIFVVCT